MARSSFTIALSHAIGLEAERAAGLPYVSHAALLALSGCTGTDRNVRPRPPRHAHSATRSLSVDGIGAVQRAKTANESLRRRRHALPRGTQLSRTTWSSDRTSDDNLVAPPTSVRSLRSQISGPSCGAIGRPPATAVRILFSPSRRRLRRAGRDCGRRWRAVLVAADHYQR